MIGILLSLVLLMYLAYRGVSVLILAPVLALLAALLAGAPLLGTYTQIFMTALGGYVIKYFPLFLLGAIFGKLMEASGSAKVIAMDIVGRVGADRAVLAVVLACGVLTYGGVSLFVVAFAVYPIAAALFVRADDPKRLIPAAIALGSFTFTMTALPGTPAIQNAIPAPFFGTDAFAAPILGIIAGLIMFGGGTLWLTWRIKRLKAAGEGYGENDSYAADRDLHLTSPDEDLPPSWAAYAPIVIVILLNLALTRWVFPYIDTSFLAEPKFGPTTLDAVRGLWAIIAALFVSIVVLVALNFARLKAKLNDTLTDGVTGSFLPIFNTASEVGYGSVIAGLPAFVIIRDAVTGIAPGNPLISEAVAVNVLAGITGSASGGMSIALQALGSTYLEMANQLGISPDLLHRVAAISSGGFDCLPHNGAVITLFAITGLNHRKSYPDLFIVAVAIPVTALIILIILGSTFGSF